MERHTESYRPLPRAILLVCMVAVCCWGYPEQGRAADDDGHPVTLTELQAKGPHVATEFTGTVTDHQALANFAWREFIALNTPAATLPAGRGTPDSAKSFVDSGVPDFYSSGKKSGQLGTNLLVWQTYAHRSELFPSNQVSQAWGSAPNYVFGNSPTFGSGVLQLYNNLDEGSQIVENFLFFPSTPPNPYHENGVYNPNMDQQVLFEAKVNETEYNYGRSFGSSLPTKPLTLPNNSIETKAAWRLVTKGMDTSRYHTADAVYYTGTDAAPVAKNGTFALIGLHIIHKTANYPSFIFATFEQIDALRLPNNGGSTGLYYITDYQNLGYSDGSPTQASINNGSGSVQNVALPLAGPLPTHGLPAPFAGPFTVVQPPTVTGAVSMVNQNVQNLMNQTNSGFSNSVWRYYQLKGVQAIPTDEQSPSGPPEARTLDFYLANIVIESSPPGLQLFKGGISAVPPSPTDGTFYNVRAGSITLGGNTTKAKNVAVAPNAYNDPQYTMGGCMGCHGQAQQQGADFSFLFVGRIFSTGGFTADVLGIQDAPTMALRAQGYYAAPHGTK